MIKASHNKFRIHFFTAYSRLLMKLYFRRVNYIGHYEEKNLPVLILANHFSWFDGFIQTGLNNRFFHRRYFVMMLEEQLRKHMFLRKVGCFSIEKGSRNIMESLNYSIEILKDRRNALLLHPQGRIQSLYTEPLEFEKGLEYILNKIDYRADMIFNVNLIDYFSHQRPEMNCYFQSFSLSEKPGLKEIETAYNRYMQICKLKQKEEWPG